MQNRLEAARAAPPNINSDSVLIEDNSPDISVQQSLDIQELQKSNSNSINTSYDNYQNYSDGKVKTKSYLILHEVIAGCLYNVLKMYSNRNEM